MGKMAGGGASGGGSLCDSLRRNRCPPSAPPLLPMHVELVGYMLMSTVNVIEVGHAGCTTVSPTAPM
jgi:hypothetical protein